MEFWIVRWRSRRKQEQQEEIGVVQGVRPHISHRQTRANHKVEEVDQGEAVEEEVSFRFRLAMRSS